MQQEVLVPVGLKIQCVTHIYVVSYG